MAANYKAILKEVCTYFALDFDICTRQISLESGFDPHALSVDKHDAGIAQFRDDGTWTSAYRGFLGYLQTNSRDVPESISNYGLRDDRYDGFTALWVYGYWMAVGIPNELVALGYPVNYQNVLVSYVAGPGSLANDKWKSYPVAVNYVSKILGSTADNYFLLAAGIFGSFFLLHKYLK